MPRPSANRRFIAGAVCPRCSAMDTLVVDRETDQRECVSCGFAEARPVESPRQEPLTRVNRPTRRNEVAAESVKLVDPASSRADRGRKG